MKLEKTDLNKIGIERLNDMQIEMLNSYTESSDIILISSTGSGKSLAFLLPIIENTKFENGVLKAVIIAPMRELALQIESVLRSLGSGLRVVCCYGGHSLGVERRSLEYTPDIIVATPGRLADHVRGGYIDLSTTESIVLDEFDKSLEMGFAGEMSEIFGYFKSLKHKLLISATTLDDIPLFTTIKSPKLIDYRDTSESIKPDISIRIVQVAERDQKENVLNILAENQGKKGIVFCNFRDDSESMSDYLWRQGVENDFFHGGMEQRDRERVLIKYRNGSIDTLIATDLAGRGLDIDGVAFVIHYGVPKTEEQFIHRNGRSGRMNQSGEAYIIKVKDRYLPEYIDETQYPLYTPIEERYNYCTDWRTVYIGRGKKEKLSKGDILGFLCSKGGISSQDVGNIDIKDYHAYVAVRAHLAKELLSTIFSEKLKGRRAKISLCK